MSHSLFSFTIKPSVLSKKNYLIYFLIIFFPFVATTGCRGNLGVAKEMLEPILPQEFECPYPSHETWQAVTTVVDSRITRFKGHVLVEHPMSFTISWIERLNTKSDNDEELVGNYESDQARRLHESEIFEVGETGIAITTVNLRETVNGSLMRVRRVYYGPLTQPRMVHSRGFFASLFQDLVNRELGANEGSKLL